MSGVEIDAKFVVAPAEILNKCVSGADDAGRTELFQSPHWPQPGLQAPVIGFDGIIGVLLHDMARRGQQFIDHSRVGRRLIGADLARAWTLLLAMSTLRGPGVTEVAGPILAGVLIEMTV